MTIFDPRSEPVNIEVIRGLEGFSLDSQPGDQSAESFLLALAESNDVDMFLMHDGSSPAFYRSPRSQLDRHENAVLTPARAGQEVGERIGVHQGLRFGQFLARLESSLAEVSGGLNG